MSRRLALAILATISLAWMSLTTTLSATSPTSLEDELLRKCHVRLPTRGGPTSGGHSCFCSDARSGDCRLSGGRQGWCSP